MSLYGYHITKFPGIVILISENILPRSVSLPPYTKSLSPEKSKGKKKRGVGDRKAQFSFIQPLMQTILI